MRTAEEILLDVFNPASMDCQTYREDLQLAITLNPTLGLIEKSINQAREEAINECAENAKSEWVRFGTNMGHQVDRQSILKLIEKLK